MEVKLAFKDNDVESAIIQISMDKQVQIGQVTETNDDGKEVNKVEIKYIDNGTKTVIPHRLDLNELVKFIVLLKRFGKQL